MLFFNCVACNNTATPLNGPQLPTIQWEETRGLEIKGMTAAKKSKRRDAQWRTESRRFPYLKNRVYLALFQPLKKLGQPSLFRNWAMG
jgi:hypothetical protein